MIKLSCEACGSTELKKEGEYYVCEHCGSRYTLPEHERRMKRIENLYREARLANATGDTVSAQRNYDILAKEVPEDWEASFFSSYYQIADCRIYQIESAANQLGQLVENYLYKLIIARYQNYSISEDEFVEAMTSITEYTRALCKGFFETSLNHFNEFHNAKNLGHEMGKDSIDYGNRVNACVFTLLKLAAAMTNKEIIDITKLNQLGVKCAKDAVYMVNDHYGTNALKNMLDNAVKCIRSIEPGYETPPIISDRFSSNVTAVFLQGAKNANKGTDSSGGCYIATAVYGSYDCPEVWTLRRFRDEKLMKSFAGRTFVKTYYAVSPTVVRLFGNQKWFNRFWQGKLNAMVRKLNEEGYDNTPYYDR